MSVCITLNDKISAIFSEKLHLEIPSPNADLVEAGVMDSLTFVSLLLHLEEEFGTKISIDDIEIDHFRSVVKIAEFVTNHNGVKNSPSSEYLGVS